MPGFRVSKMGGIQVRSEESVNLTITRYARESEYMCVAWLFPYSIINFRGPCNKSVVLKKTIMPIMKRDLYT